MSDLNKYDMTILWLDHFAYKYYLIDKYTEDHVTKVVGLAKWDLVQ